MLPAGFARLEFASFVQPFISAEAAGIFTLITVATVALLSRFHESITTDRLAGLCAHAKRHKDGLFLSYTDSYRYSMFIMEDLPTKHSSLFFNRTALMLRMLQMENLLLLNLSPDVALAYIM